MLAANKVQFSRMQRQPACRLCETTPPGSVIHGSLTMTWEIVSVLVESRLHE